jgi:hypothetical protein
MAKPKLSYANVASTLALVIALGTGSAWAAHQLAPKSVGEKQLRPGAVTAEKIRKNAITAPKIKAQAVKQGKIAGAAVVGSKLAAGAVSSEKLTDGAVTTTKLATASVTGAKVDEQSLSEVPSAARADTASFAESADPAAFAAVSAEGNVDSALSKGITSANVTEPVLGIYCLSVPSFAPRGAQVTPRYSVSGTSTAYVTVGGTGSCPFPQVEVQMHDGGLIKAPFYISFYR